MNTHNGLGKEKKNAPPKLALRRAGATAPAAAPTNKTLNGITTYNNDKVAKNKNETKQKGVSGVYI